MNETEFVIRYLQVIVKFSGWRIDQPHFERFLFSADDVVLKLAVETVGDDGRVTNTLKEYKLWQLSEVFLRENPHIIKNKYDIIDAWLWEKLISTHPLRNKVLDYRFAVYEDQPIPKAIKYDSLLNELL